jgi:hypothetical protein
MRHHVCPVLPALIAVLCACADGTSAQALTPSAAPAPAAVGAATLANTETPAASGKPLTLPTAQELLKKFADATGGEEVWSKMTTRMIKGIYQTEDASTFAGIETTSKAPNKTLTKITFPNGATVRETCDGRSAWLEGPTGRTVEFTGAALESRLKAANFDDRGRILLAALTGRVLGQVRVGTHTAYMMEFMSSKKVTSKLYFDAQSGFVVRSDDTIHQDGGDYTVETYMDDYRPVDGAYYAFRIRHVEKGNIFTVRVTQIKNNLTVDDTAFAKPESMMSAR